MSKNREMVSGLEVSLLSAATGVFDWATNTFNCGLLNYIFTVTGNDTIKLSQTRILSSILTAINQNVFQGGSRTLEVYKWLPVELQDGSGDSHNVAILAGVAIIFSLLLFFLPLAVIIVSCHCHCCLKAYEENAMVDVSLFHSYLHINE